MPGGWWKHADPVTRRRWLRLRRAKMEQMGGWCERCPRRAVEVHHIAPVMAGGNPLPPLSGLLAVCHLCHRAEHARLRGDVEAGRWFGLLDDLWPPGR